MKALIACLLLCLLPGAAAATSVTPRALEQIVADADHVLAGRITRVDMVDAWGKPVRNRDARTGPGMRNQMRFHLAVDEVLSSNCMQPPRQIIIPLWQMWHYRLGDMQDQVTGSSGIFLLKGPGFTPAYYASFQRSLEERDAIESLLAKRPAVTLAAQVTCSTTTAPTPSLQGASIS